MADIALVTAGKINVVESLEQHTLVAGVAVAAGQMVRFDTTTGKWALALADTAGNARAYGMALRTVAAGEPVTALRRGIVDGFNISQAYDAAVYLSNTSGAIADAAGTVSTVLGRVIPLHGPTLGTALDKAILLNVAS